MKKIKRKKAINVGERVFYSPVKKRRFAMSFIDLMIKKMLIPIQSQRGQWRANKGVMPQQVMNTLIQDNFDDTFFAV